MEKLVHLIGFCVLVIFTGGCFSGSAPVYTNHRSTSLEELKQIDGLVSANLPLFDHGFFVQTENGPVLVKAKEEGPGANKPRLNPGYYRTLPRLIPAGYEGIATSHFNLGSAIPAQVPVPVQQNHQTYQNYQPENNNAPIQQYQNVAAPIQQYSQNSAGPIQQYSQNVAAPIQQFSQNQQYSQNVQYTQHSTSHNFEHQQSSQSRSQQYIHRGPLNRPQHQQRQIVQHQPQQSLQQFEPQQHLQQRQHRQERFLNQHQPSQRQPLAQDTFQINNFLSNGDEDLPVPTSYQNQVINHGPNKFITNPTVEQAFGFEDTLPDHFRNPFYKNQDLAQALAQESLPVEGEEVVGQWDTTKIQKQKIQDLLRAAGFI